MTHRGRIALRCLRLLMLFVSLHREQLGPHLLRSVRDKDGDGRFAKVGLLLDFHSDETVIHQIFHLVSGSDVTVQV